MEEKLNAGFPIAAFDEYADEITKEEVDDLLALWLSRDWPGRQRTRA
jgi:hypothetical protein